jgi:hypothetical protein
MSENIFENSIHIFLGILGTRNIMYPANHRPLKKTLAIKLITG